MWLETAYDVASATYSYYQYLNDPTLGNALFLFWDLFSLVTPGVPALGMVRRIDDLPILNVGSGRRPRRGAINLDIEAHRGVDVIADARRMPFKDALFGSIVATKLPGPLAGSPEFVAELYRVLQEGGTIELHSITGFGTLTLEEFRRAGFRDITVEQSSGFTLRARK
jgi:hypothetical protein